MLYNFTVLFHGLLRPGHCLIVALGDLMDWFKKFKPYLGQLQPPTLVHHLNLPTLAVHWVQVRVAKWLKDQYTMPGIIFVPVQTKIFDHIKINDPEWILLMPNCLLPLVQLGIAPTTPLLNR